MLSQNNSIAVEALKKALLVRQEHGYKRTDAFCVFDLTEKIGIELRFVDVNSFEGAFVLTPKKNIHISANRPQARQRFTCAHELGHFFYNHGMSIDEAVDEERCCDEGAQELEANLFASFLLMPSTTVCGGFASRGLDINTASPLDIYKVSTWLGVGYTTLIGHLHYGIKKLSADRFIELKTMFPKSIIEKFLGIEWGNSVYPVDAYWKGRPVDISINDLVITPQLATIDGENVKYMYSSNGCHYYLGVKPGIGKMSFDEWSSFVRVSRRPYIGRGKFRHLGE